MKSKRFIVIYIVSLVIASFGLRSFLNAVGPIVGEIKQSTGMTSGQAGTLTSIPTIIFAATAFFAGVILPRFRVRDSAVFCLGLMAVGGLLRPFTGIAGLFIGTIMLGTGIGILNVLIPTLNREKMAFMVGTVTGVYNVSMNTMAGIASGFSASLSKVFGSWQKALAIWGVLPLIAIPLWAYLTRMKEFDDRVGEVSASPIQASKRYFNSKVMKISCCMGSQGFIYYGITAWMPTLLMDAGMSSRDAGYLLLFLQAISLPMAFIVPRLSVKRKNRRALALIGGASYVIAMCILLSTTDWFWLGVGGFFCGIGSGSCFSYTLSMITMSGESRAETSWVSGFVQLFGYTVTAIAPFLFGELVDLSGSWRVPLVLMLLFGGVYYFFARSAGDAVPDRS